MVETPEWPSYRVGNHKGIFALGVASIKYAELESIFTLVFAIATEVPSWTATMIHAKCGTPACVQITYQALPPLEMIGPPTRVEAELRYFLKAFEICTENRNHLMHSAMLHQSPDDNALLYKTSKQGNAIISLQPLPKMRQVADDMRAYLNYGRALVNAISVRRPDSPAFFPTSLFPWPDRPAPPHKLDYSPDPSPIPRTHPTP
jgi:hypothetical protein